MKIKFLVTAMAVAGVILLSAQPPAGKGKGAPKEDNTPRGLRLKTAKASPGYVLFSPLTTTSSYLMDMDGKIVREWKSDMTPEGFIYMLDNGHVIRGGSDPGETGMTGGGAGGRIEEWDFDGKLVWDFKYNTNAGLLHHDITVMPNGHILAVVWEKKTAEEARAVGRREQGSANGVWSDAVVEFEPQRPNGAKIVWEWHAWDHLVKSDDMAKHPERIDINGDRDALFAAPGPGAAKGKGPGPGDFKGGPKGPPAGPGGAKGDGKGKGGPAEPQATEVFHVNAINYNKKLDQVMISAPNFDEIWIIDHSTTTAEAKTSKGGKQGKGGDLLYRWGNPQNYGRGTAADQKLGFEHDARWLDDGHITIFSNRTPGPNGQYTKVYEIVPPVDSKGRYTLPEKGPYGPAEPVWTYSDPPTFDANFISGAQRLPNGNSFISQGPAGRMFEITGSGEIVWEYWSAFRGAPGVGGPLSASNPYAFFRGQKLAPDYPGLKGRKLVPQQ